MFGKIVLYWEGSKYYVKCVLYTLKCIIKNNKYNNTMYNKYCIWLFRFTSSPEGIDNYCRKSINIQNNIEILKIRVFSTPISPRAAGRRRHAHRLRWLPVGGPPLGDFFFTELIKTNDFNVKIVIFKCV